jgi:predicted negative regulator of RcsB-dependent stress response
MAKRKIKEDIKKPDIVIRTITSIGTFAKDNRKQCIIGLAVVVIIISSVYGYIFYERKQDEKAQYVLFQGIRSFEQYGVSGKEENLVQAETTFRKVVDQKQGKIYRIAELYLAKIDTIKGKNEEAKNLYKTVTNESSGLLLKALSEKALQKLEKQ